AFRLNSKRGRRTTLHLRRLLFAAGAIPLALTQPLHFFMRSLRHRSSGYERPKSRDIADSRKSFGEQNWPCHALLSFMLMLPPRWESRESWQMLLEQPHPVPNLLLFSALRF